MARSIWTTLVCLVFLSSLASTQVVYDGNNNLPPFGGFSGSDFDIISLQNGNLHISIPILEVPQRGAKPIKYTFLYDTPDYTYTVNPPKQGQDYYTYTWTPDYYYTGWELRHSLQWGFDTEQGSTVPCYLGTQTKTYIKVIVDPSRTKHPADILTTDPPCTIQQPKGWTTDGSGIWADVSVAPYVIMLKDGSQPLLKDTNGNLVTQTTSGDASVTADTLNRNLLVTTTGPTQPMTTPLGFYGVTYSQTWTYTDSNGASQTWTLNNTTIDKALLCTGQHCGENILRTMIVPESLVLPNGTSYTFKWNDNSHGEIQEIDLPTGGSISYTYTWQCQQNPYTDLQVSDCRKSVASRTVTQGGTTAIWHYSSAAGIVTDPFNNDEVHTFSYIGSSYGTYETQVTYWQGSSLPGAGGTLLKTVNTTYASENGPNHTANVRPIEVDIIQDGRTRSTQTDYETFSTTGMSLTNPPALGTYTATRMNVTALREYEYTTGAPPGTLLRQTKYVYGLNGNSAYTNPNIVDRVTQKTVYDGSNNQLAQTVYEYDNYSHANQAMVASGAVRHDSAFGTGYTTRGNVTAVSQWRKSDGALLTTTNQYDDAGNVLSSIDPLGHKTSFDFTDSWSNSTCAPSGQGKAYVTKITNALNQFASKSYNSCTGAIASTTDLNLLITSYSYDGMSRITQTSRPDGGQTTYCYTDQGGTGCTQASSPPFQLVTTKKINSNRSEKNTSVFDGLGRLTQTQLTSDPQGTVYTDTTYDGLSRVATVSNPYRGGTDPTSSPGVTTYTYDALGRKTKEAYADNSILTTAYCGPSTLVTDPAGKWRRSRVNGLGQLVEVDEPNFTSATVASTGCPGTGEPIWVTSYTNDALGNLTQVIQNGSHTRTFTYDSLSQLLTAANPENGTITYTYNPDNTLLTKKDARNITATYAYDALHRETGVTHSNSDPALTFTYDETGCLGLTACQNIGHRTSMTDGAGSEKWAYQVDPANLRSLDREQRTTNSSPSNITKTTSYNLDLAGNVTQLIYPTGRIVNYTYDAADRPSTATDSANGITYATAPQSPVSGCLADAVCYTPQGSVYSESIGRSASFTGFNFAGTYNSRLQPLELKGSSSAGNAMDVTYNFVDPVSLKNAGQVYGITNNLNSSRSQFFTYDQLNRIVSAGTSATTGVYCWGYQYSYDVWGNLLAQSPWTPTYNGCSETSMAGVTADGSNHISGLSYDTSGNTLGDGTNTYTWDGESQLKTAAGVTYAYDGDGRRVAKVGAKLYWYGSGGEILAETNAQGTTPNEYIFFGGKRVALVPSGGTPLFYAEDLLGSAHVIVQSTGTLCYDGDFTPFGAERAVTHTCPQNYKFEGKERDTETGNDEFGARSYSNRFGRWLSSDWSSVPVPVPYANFGNPQSLNLYSYVTNNPLTLLDDDGHDIIYAAGLQNAQLVKDSVQAILANPNTSANLSGYVGKDNPNLTIQSGDLSAEDTRTVSPDGQTVTTTTVQGNTAPDIQTSTITSNGVTSAPETILTGATITIDNRTSKGDTPGVMVHESVHAGEAKANPVQFSRDAAAEKPQPHNQRPQEQRAIAAQKAFGNKIKKEVKQIQKARKKENQ